jgi:DNA repair protein RecN (Recombination protein N)
MITGLSVANFAVAKNITLDLSNGLTVITGETGAGKSILVGALLVGIGGRWQSDSLRHGAEKATIEMVFSFKPSELNLIGDKSMLEDNELIVSRTIDSEGKSRIRLGGMQATLGTLKETTSKLVDVHSQFEAQSLLDPKIHLELLDRYAGTTHLEIISSFALSSKKLEALIFEQKTMLEKEAERAKRIDYINYELAEFDKIAPKLGEDDELETERRKLQNVQKLADLCDGIKTALDGSEDFQGIKTLTKTALKNAVELCRIDESLNESKTMLENIEANSVEISHDLADYLASLTFDPERLQIVEDRLAQLQKITKRFGMKLPEVFDGIERLKMELETLNTSEERLKTIETDITLERNNLGTIGEKIVTGRENAGEKLAREVMNELTDLALEKAFFAIEARLLQPSDEKYCIVFGEKSGFNQSGPQYIEFIISTNPGEPPKSMQKVASGGELSRIMLALKVILSKVDQTPTLIFDEVDSGVGGRVGEMIGRKLAILSRERQVICITHLPQIASFCDTHLLITKSEFDNETIVECNELAKRGRIDELARMLSGDKITPLSIKHAEEMLLQSGKIKEAI